MFNSFEDKKTTYIIMAVLIVLSIGSYINNTDRLIGLLITIPAVLIAITFHEFAHAFAADKLGDDTPRREGRLSLNPLAHLDPIGTVMLVFAGFGWGKPVQVNPRNFNRNMSMSAAEAIVSAAGPIMNFILAIVFTIIMCIIAKFAPAFLLTEVGAIVGLLIEETIIINIGLGVFNLIPIPPLDGSKILAHILPSKARDFFETNSHIFYIIFIVLWITGILGSIISPIISVVYNGIIRIIATLFGLM